MVLSKDTNPLHSVYYTGSILVNVLQDQTTKKIDIVSAYERANVVAEVSMQLFLLSMDWLFILGLVKLTKRGVLEKCF